MLVEDLVVRSESSIESGDGAVKFSETRRSYISLRNGYGT